VLILHSFHREWCIGAGFFVAQERDGYVHKQCRTAGPLHQAERDHRRSQNRSAGNCPDFKVPSMGFSESREVPQAIQAVGKMYGLEAVRSYAVS
jgi:hypothetical protein